MLCSLQQELAAALHGDGTLTEYMYRKVIWQREKFYYLVLTLYLLRTWEIAEPLNTIFSSLVNHSCLLEINEGKKHLEWGTNFSQCKKYRFEIFFLIIHCTPCRNSTNEEYIRENIKSCFSEGNLVLILPFSADYF